MRKRILVVGDLKNFHMYNYISQAIVKADAEIVALHTLGTMQGFHEKFLSFYKENGVEVVLGVDPSTVRGRFHRFKFLKSAFTLFNSLGHFDVLHIQNMNSAYVLPSFFARKQFKKIVLTYWGSDLYRSNSVQRLMTLPLLQKADIITMMSKDMLDYFSKLSFVFSRHKNKCQVIDFGDMLYPIIDKLKSGDVSVYKKEFGINEDRIVITIGYKGRPEMRQLESVLSLLPYQETIAHRVHLFFPLFTMEDKDIEKLANALDKTSYQYTLYPEFMYEEQVSRLRVITGIFVNPQTTDALSNAMLESLYAGAAVANGSWLKYSILDDMGVLYYKFDTMDELGKVVSSLVDSIETIKKETIINRDKIYEISSWESLQKKWLALYN